MCKINIAAYGRRILPHRQQVSAASCFRGYGVSLYYAYKVGQLASVGGKETQFMLDLEER